MDCAQISHPLASSTVELSSALNVSSGQGAALFPLVARFEQCHDTPLSAWNFMD